MPENEKGEWEQALPEADTDIKPGYHLIANKTKYKVELFDALGQGSQPIVAYDTHGSWVIEGDFLITWDENDVRHAVRIPNVCTTIKTSPATEEEDDSVGRSGEDDAAEGGAAGTGSDGGEGTPDAGE